MRDVSILTDNGVETDLVTGATYDYDGEDSVAVTNAYTDAITVIDCL